MSDLLSPIWEAEWFSTTASWLVQASVYSTWLALIVLVVCLTVGRRLAPRFRHALWLLVAARLVMPVAPESPWSLHQLWQLAPSHSSSTAIQIQVAPVSATSSPIQPITLQPAPGSIERSSWTAALESILDVGASCIEVLLQLWPWGMLAMAAWIAMASHRLHRQLRRIAMPAGGPILELLDTCRGELRISRRVELFIVPGLHSPAQLGVFRPRILLPDDVAREFSTEELRHILLHELVHVKRNDGIVNGFLAVLRVIHWWNPVFWFTQRRMLIERELACDAHVVTAIGETNFASYGRTLLRVVERLSMDRPAALRLPASVPGLILFLDRTAAIKGRLRALRTTRVGSGKMARSLAWTLCLSLALAGWTDAQTNTPDQTQFTGEILAIPSTSAPLLIGDESPQTPLVTMTFDASEILDRIVRDRGVTREQARQELLDGLTAYNQFGIRPNPVANVPAKRPTPFDGIWYQGTDQLVCRGSEQILAGIAKLLQAWRDHGMQQVVVEIRHIDSPLDLVKGISLPGGDVIVPTKELDKPSSALDLRTPSDGNGQGVSTQFASRTTVERRVPVYLNSLSAIWRDRLSHVAQAEQRSNLLFAPKVTVHLAQQAMFSSETQRPFVVGLHTSESNEIKPVIDIVREGWGINISPLVITASGRIRLEGEIHQSQVVDVAVATLPLGQDAKQRSVQIPTVEQRVYRISTEIAADETLLLHPLELTREGRRTYFLISAKVARQKP